MIRVDRGPEPQALVEERSRRLALAALDGRPVTSADFDGYDGDDVRQTLLEAQVYRCAYCELPIDEAGYPIEHFRPKTFSEDVRWDAVGPPPADPGQFNAWFARCFTDRPAGASPWAVDRERYWWLAWTWENLFYGCPSCNSQTYKGNKLPFARGAVRLAPMTEPPGQETPLLLDPSTTDPLDHIRFAPDRAPHGWGPVARTDTGRWTIALLGLHTRTGLRDHWRRCARQIETDPHFKAALGAMERGDDQGVRGHWDDLLRRWLYREQDFLALRWCVFDHHFPEAYRHEHGLPLPRPGRLSTRAPNPLWEVRPELEGLSEQVMLRVRALSSNAISVETQRLIVDLCAERPLDADDLMRILRRSRLTIEMHLAPLLVDTNPRLTGDPASGKFHPSR